MATTLITLGSTPALTSDGWGASLAEAIENYGAVMLNGTSLADLNRAGKVTWVDKLNLTVEGYGTLAITKVTPGSTPLLHSLWMQLWLFLQGRTASVGGSIIISVQ